MKYLLDTNICIAYVKGDMQIKKKLLTLSPDDVAICSIVKAELLYGILKSQLRAKNELSFKNFIQQFHSYPFDDDSAKQQSIVRVTLEQAGTPIGAHDLMIAAIALQHGLTLVTRNLREFERIHSLSVEAW